MWLGFMSLTPSDDAIPFDYNGRTYYADRKAIEGFDKTLQYTAARDVIVNAIVLIAPERSFADKTAGRLFEHPDFDPAGIYTMPNMTTLESLNLYAAAIDFLAERYSRPDKKYGRVHHWIAHNEVDAGWVWTNAGIKTPLRFMDIYIKSMRLLYYTAQMCIRDRCKERSGSRRYGPARRPAREFPKRLASSCRSSRFGEGYR